MEAKELMAGDIVKQKHSGLILKVSAIVPPYIRAEGEDGQFHEDTVEPIPLTPEILARLGCFTVEEVPKYDDTYTDDEYTATMKFTDARKCEVEIEYKTYWKKLRAFNHDPHNRLQFTSIETQIEYVHELQHILRVLKVDKELELLN